MALRVIVAALLAAVLMFLWGFVYWGPVLNMMPRLTEPLPADYVDDLLPPMRAARMASGMYVYPGPLRSPDDPAAQRQWEEQLAEGPVFHLAFRAGETSPFDPVMFAQGWLHSFVLALLAGGLLATVVHALPSYASRLGFLLLAGLIASLWTTVASAIWWAHPPKYAVGQIAYELGAAVMMALVVAAIVRPPGLATGKS